MGCRGAGKEDKGGAEAVVFGLGGGGAGVAPHGEPAVDNSWPLLVTLLRRALASLGADPTSQVKKHEYSSEF